MKRVAGVVALVLLGAALRLTALDRLPGLNADEAWYGVNVEDALAGRPYFDHTPVGNRLNPFHSGPLLLVSLVSAPSFALLRFPAALWGVLAIVASYPLLARPLGSGAALIATALLSVSAAAVAQSRLGWDPSGTVLFALLAIGLALGDRPILAAAAGLAALAVHPTNIFLAPIAGATWAPHGWARLARASRSTQRLAASAAILLAVAGPIAGFFVARSLAPRGPLPSIEMVLDRAISPSQWIDSGSGLMRLAAGVTTAGGIAGPLDGISAGSVSALVLLACVFAVVMPFANKDDRPRPALWLAAGTLIGAIAFHVIAGPRGLQPGTERYAMSFVVPITIVAALGLDAVWRRSAIGGAALTGLTWLALAFVLIGGYFVPLARGQAAHEAYRTGPVEPKAAAMQFIRQDSAGAGVVTIVAENWWLYWPIRYLASRDARIFVEQLEPETLPLRPAGVAPPSYPRPPDRVYAVVFAGSANAVRVASLGSAVFTAADAGGHPILQVFLIPPDRADQLLDPAPAPRGF